MATVLSILFGLRILPLSFYEELFLAILDLWFIRWGVTAVALLLNLLPADFFLTPIPWANSGRITKLSEKLFRHFDPSHIGRETTPRWCA